MIDFLTLPLWLNLLLFLVAGTGVWIAGTQLATYADIISDRTGWSKAFMGYVFLATATQLPEIVTYTTGALCGNAPLVLNNMFGGITMQTAILTIADLFIVGTTLTYAAQKSINQLQGAILTLALALLLAVIMLGDVLVFRHLGLAPLLLAGFYVFAIFIFKDYGKNSHWEPLNIPEQQKQKAESEPKDKNGKISTRKLVLHTGFASFIILICGVLLMRTAEAVAGQTGLGSSFIGVTLLAGATSLPELSTSIAAVRRGVHGMAISNIFGSNLIVVFLLLPVDLLYREGAILNAADPSARFALISGIIVTAVYLTGLILRKQKRFLGMGIDSLIVLLLYVGSLFILYHLK